MINIHRKTFSGKNSIRTSLKKIGKNKWEFNPTYGYTSDEDKLTALPILNKEDLKDLVKGIKTLIKEKHDHWKQTFNYNFNWKNNPTEMCLGGGYDFKENKYYLYFQSKNKYYKGFNYVPEHYGWDPRVTPDSFAGISISVTIENLEKYIQEVENEINEITN